MYLTEEIIDLEGTNYNMVGLVPGQIKMNDSLQAMGYVTVQASQDNILLKQGQTVKDHEFYYSKLVAKEQDIDYTYQFKEKDKQERIKFKNLLASYVHLHFASNPDVITNFLNCCNKYKRGN